MSKTAHLLVASATTVPHHLVHTLEDLEATEPSHLSRRKSVHLCNLRIALENEIARECKSRYDDLSS